MKVCHVPLPYKCPPPPCVFAVVLEGIFGGSSSSPRWDSPLPAQHVTQLHLKGVLEVSAICQSREMDGLEVLDTGDAVCLVSMGRGQWQPGAEAVRKVPVAQVVAEQGREEPGLCSG